MVFILFSPPLQIYHFCHSNGKQDTFHCPYGTIFNEYLGTCDHDEAVYCRGGDGYKAPAPHKHQASYHETGGGKALRKKISASKSKGKYMCCLPFFYKKTFLFQLPTAATTRATATTGGGTTRRHHITRQVRSKAFF